MSDMGLGVLLQPAAELEPWPFGQKMTSHPLIYSRSHVNNISCTRQEFNVNQDLIRFIHPYLEKSLLGSALKYTNQRYTRHTVPGENGNHDYTFFCLRLFGGWSFIKFCFSEGAWLPIITWLFSFEFQF